MKMKLIDRFLIGLFSLIGVALAAALVYELFFPGEIFTTLLIVPLNLPNDVFSRIIIVAAALILLAWSIKILTIVFKRERTKVPSTVSVQNSENGSVRISVAALDTLISHALEHQEGIKSVKSKVINHEDSISVAIEMSLTSDVHIPNITMLLQKTVKNYIEEYSGIAVREVTVLISSIVEVVPLPLALEDKFGADTIEVTAEAFEAAAPETEQKPESEPAVEEAAEPEEFKPLDDIEIREETALNGAPGAVSE